MNDGSRMKFDDLPNAYKERLADTRQPSCECYLDAFIEAYASDLPSDNRILEDELMSFARRYPGDNDPYYAISLVRSIQFDDGYWPRMFELTLRYELSTANYWLPRHQSTCPSRGLSRDFLRELKASPAFRWYRRSQPCAVSAYIHTEDAMLDILRTMGPLLCGKTLDVASMFK